MRRFLPVAAWSVGVIVAAVLVVALSIVVITGIGYAAIPAAVASVWMVAHLAPLSFGAVVLGAVPALPAVLTAAVTAAMVRRGSRGRLNLTDLRYLVGVTVFVPVLVTVLAWLMLWDASHVYEVAAPPLWRAVLTTAAVHGIGVIVGLGRTLWRGVLRSIGLPDWLIEASALAGRWLMALAGAGLLIVLASMVWHHGQVTEAFTIAPDPASAAWLTVLCALYLPNAAVAGGAVLLGADTSVGLASVSLFAVTPGSLPPLPLLAAMPQSGLSPAWAVLLVVPALLAGWLVWRHAAAAGLGTGGSGTGEDAGAADTDGDAEAGIEGDTGVGGGLWAVLVAAGLAAAGAGLAAVLTGGEVGLYGWSGASWWLTALLSGVWLGCVGTAVVLVSGVRRGTGVSTQRVTAEAPGTATDVVPDSGAPKGEPAGAENRAQAGVVVGAGEPVGEPVKETADSVAEGPDDDVAEDMAPADADIAVPESPADEDDSPAGDGDSEDDNEADSGAINDDDSDAGDSTTADGR